MTKGLMKVFSERFGHMEIMENGRIVKRDSVRETVKDCLKKKASDKQGEWHITGVNSGVL